MKLLIIAAVFGLILGWIVSRSITDQPHEGAVGALFAEERTSLAIPPPAVVPAGKTFGVAWADTRNRATNSSNPFRDQLRILDQIRSLQPAEIVTAFRSGDISDQHAVSPHGEDRVLEAAFETLARSGAAAALTLADEIVDDYQFSMVQNRVLETCIRSDSDDLLRAVEMRPTGSFRTNLVRTIARVWGEYDPHHAAIHLVALNDLQSTYLEDSRIEFDPNLAPELFGVWAAKDFEGAERWILEESNPRWRDRFHRQLLRSRLRWGGEDAINFITGRGDEASRVFLKGAFLSWAHHKPEAALDRFVTMLEEPDLREATEAMGGQAAEGLCRGAHKVAISDLMTKLPDERTRQEFVLGALVAAGEMDLKIAGEIIGTIPEIYDRKKALAKIAEKWVRQDPAALKTWISALEPSESRSFALAKIATKVAESDLEAGRGWAEIISDEKVREQTLRYLHYSDE